MVSPWVGPDYKRAPSPPLWPEELAVFEIDKSLGEGKKELKTPVAQKQKVTSYESQKADKDESKGREVKSEAKRSFSDADNVVVEGEAQKDDTTLSKNDTFGGDSSAQKIQTAKEQEDKKDKEDKEDTGDQDTKPKVEIAAMDAEKKEEEEEEEEVEPPYPSFLNDDFGLVDIASRRLTTDGKKQICANVPLNHPCQIISCNCARALDAGERHERVWTDMEKCIFLDKFMQFPKNFAKIASFLINRDTKDCIRFYYDSKPNIPYKSLLKEAENRKRKVKSQWVHASDAAQVLALPLVMCLCIMQ